MRFSTTLRCSTRLAALGLSLGLLLGTPASAEPHYSRAYDQCMASGDAAQGQTAAMIDCLNGEYARRDNILNQVYGATMARLAPERKTALRLDERAWLKANDPACAHDQMEDGTLGQIEMHQCYVERTIARTALLRQYR